jgi:hypothetical protein
MYLLAHNVPTEPQSLIQPLERSHVAILEHQVQRALVVKSITKRDQVVRPGLEAASGEVCTGMSEGGA